MGCIRFALALRRGEDAKDGTQPEGARHVECGRANLVAGRIFAVSQPEKAKPTVQRGINLC
jgi:hypothetical protein